LQKRGIHLPEIDVVRKVAVVEFGQVGQIVQQSFLFVCDAHKHHRIGFAVIGATRCILGHPPTEFRKSNHQNIISASVLLHFGAKCVQSVVHFLEEALLLSLLLDVGIEAALRQVINARIGVA